ncbi:Na+/H+ antiporter subunit A [Ornithinibacillus halotolerans]|uniref:Na(+)/H(+) antiporter subunit A n=1 Tax=Ornithinibacillus halotolerans TaxID=1274357 RepID=A0A916RVC7_9BACI|nr:Na+/H+ antiporter subunit A [Ornithinibacillus halotolerans]GGA68964.1 Na(+)/H(+) antiporter subunit A [Ornithinibacillus halotolerans]
MIFAVLIPLVFALFIPFLSKLKDKVHTGIFVLFIPLGIFIYFIRFIGEGFSPLHHTYNWIPSLNINFSFYLDGLSLLFVLLISGIGTLVVFYSIYYLHKTEKLGHFYVYLLMFMSAMLGVVLSDNVFVLYGFWELTSISSFLLIGYWHHRERSRYGAQKSMLITIFGGLSMFGGLILLTVITGTTSIRSMIDQIDLIVSSGYLPLILVFILLGAFTKSAQFPFHIWLPDAMEAPTPVSAYLHSATMVKAGIYLVARFSAIFVVYEWFFIVVSLVGIITLVWASYMAVRQTDLKGILAFSTVSQLGMIMAMLGFGTEAAVFAAVFHILNHATFKGSLFMVAGIIDHETGTRDIRKLGGLLTFMPMSATLALFGTFSMAGVPFPFLNGFYSKELFFEATTNLNENSNAIASFLTEAIPYLAVFGSIFTFVYSMYFFFGVFTGPKKLELLPKKPHEAPIGMLISPIILVLGVILIGLFPNLVNGSLIQHAAEGIRNHAVAYTDIHFWHGFIPPFIMSLIVVGVGIILFLTRKYWTKIYEAIPGNLSFNKVYDKLVKNVDDFSAGITNSYMTGSLKLYMSLILGVIIAFSFAIMFTTGGFSNISFNDLEEISIVDIAIVLIMVLAAICTIFINNKLSLIIVTGIVGFGISILFVLLRAPDLALTQLVVETVSMALFLLAYYHLPELRKRNETTATSITNLFLALGIGTLITMVGIAAHSSDWFDTISDYFVETAYTLGGGTNIVNVILVDMRGLDTLFEITVLGIAALAIYSLIKVRKNKEAE